MIVCNRKMAGWKAGPHGFGAAWFCEMEKGHKGSHSKLPLAKLGCLRQARTLEAYSQPRGEIWEKDTDYTGWTIQRETKHRFQEGDRVKVRSSVSPSWQVLMGKVGKVIGVEDDGTVAIDLDGKFHYIRSNSLRKVD